MIQQFFTMLSALLTFRRHDGAIAASPNPQSPSAVGNQQSLLGMLGFDAGAGAMPMSGLRFSDHMLDELYEHNALAAAVVDDLVDDATRKAWKITVGNKDAELTRRVAIEDERLALKRTITDSGKAGRRYGSAYLMMVFEEAPNSLGLDNRMRVDLSKPPKRVSKVVNLVELDPEECTPVLWDTDAKSKTFRQPLVYMVSPSSEGGALSGLLIHTSRLLYFCGKRLSPRRRAHNNYRDKSVIEQAWAQISNLTQADSAIVQHLQESSLSWIKMAGKANKALSDQALITELRTKELALAKARSRVLILDEHEDFGTVATSIAGIGEQHDRLKESYSAATGEPLTRLFGQAPGGLNADGESQASSWRERVSSYQQDDLLPQLERYYTYMMQALGVDESVDWKIAFNALDEPTEQQRAEQRVRVSEMDERYITLGVYTAEEVRAQRFGVDGYQIDMAFEADTSLEDDLQEAAALRQDGARRRLRVVT